MLSVVCFKWSSPDRWFQYTADHVNRLRRMLKRHLARPHELVCLTDDPGGIDAGIQTMAIPEYVLRFGHRFPKLMLFAEEARAIGDELLLLDLDCVITGPLDPIIPEHLDFKILQGRHPRAVYNSGMLYLLAGTHTPVWDHFLPEHALNRIQDAGIKGTDQAWISLCLPGAPMWTAADGVLLHSADDCEQLPGHARIVFFNGSRADPTVPHIRDLYPWITEHWR